MSPLSHRDRRPWYNILLAKSVWMSVFVDLCHQKKFYWRSCSWTIQLHREQLETETRLPIIICEQAACYSILVVANELVSYMCYVCSANYTADKWKYSAAVVLCPYHV